MSNDVTEILKPQLEALVAELKEIRKSIAARSTAVVKPEKPERRRAEIGETYYYIDFSGYAWDKIYATTEDGHRVDRIRHDFGNYFRTKVQAEAVAVKIRQALEEAHND